MTIFLVITGFLLGSHWTMFFKSLSPCYFSPPSYIGGSRLLLHGQTRSMFLFILKEGSANDHLIPTNNYGKRVKVYGGKKQDGKPGRARGHS